MTDDPIADFLRHDRECQQWLDGRPKCRACGEPIQEDMCLYDAEGNRYHKERECAEIWAEAFIPEWMSATVEQ